MTTMRPQDDATRMIPVVPNPVPSPDETQAIPHVPAAPSTGPATPTDRDMDQTAVIRAYNPGRDATEVIPAVRPDKPAEAEADVDVDIDKDVDKDVDKENGSVEPPRRVPRKDDTGFVLFGRVRAYDSEPGAMEYRGRHGDIIPLAEASPARKIFHAIGEVMITCGLVLLLFAGYEIWGKAAIVSAHQADLDAQLEQAWGADDSNVIALPPDPNASPSPTQAGPPPIPPGGSLGRLYLPRLGKYWVVVEGIEPRDIEYAPGHYPNSALPGEVGNFSVAGHRSPAIFWDLDRMRVNDPVVVETRTTFYVYYVTNLEIVAPTAVEVVAPVPGHPGDAPSVAMLTLTTCNPKWDNYQRLILHARLDHSQPRSAGRPKELGEG
jgi:LPXTG-site transpeptidase (sortase) family protein